MMIELAILAAALGSGLIGGVFFAFSSFVMAALARRPAPEGIAAMQAINITVINPLFLGAFLGTALLSLLLPAAAFFTSGANAFLIAGSLLYLFGTFGVTIFGNIPHNNRLARLDAAGAEARAYWPDHHRLWTRWNHVRTVAALLAALAFTLALRSVQG
jgi:uncharacterized membrane protein